MGARPITIDPDNSVIVAMFKRGKTFQQIAIKLNCHRETVRARAVALGLHVATPRPNYDLPKRNIGMVDGSLSADAEPLAMDRRQWGEIAPWPAGIHFEDDPAAPVREPRGHIPPAAFTGSMIGNGTALLCAPDGFV